MLQKKEVLRGRGLPAKVRGEGCGQEEEEGSGGGECIQCSTPQQVHLKCEAILEKIILIRAKDSYLK